MEPDSVAILLGARPATRSADTHFPFRQDSDFHYLTGFDHPNAAAADHWAREVAELVLSGGRAPP